MSEKTKTQSSGPWNPDWLAREAARKWELEDRCKELSNMVITSLKRTIQAEERAKEAELALSDREFSEAVVRGYKSMAEEAVKKMKDAEMRLRIADSRLAQLAESMEGRTIRRVQASVADILKDMRTAGDETQEVYEDYTHGEEVKLGRPA